MHCKTLIGQKIKEKIKRFLTTIDPCRRKISLSERENGVHTELHRTQYKKNI